MVNCSYCNKEIERLVFCTSSHKVMFHKKLTNSKSLLTKGKRIVKELTISKQEEIKESTPFHAGYCKHNVPTLLCKHQGCRIH